MAKIIQLKDKNNDNLYPNIIKNQLLDMIYPVGTIYQNATSSTSPAVRFGGTWVQLTNRFFVGAGNSYAVGATGGDTALQAHTHTGTTSGAGGHNHGRPGQNSNIAAGGDRLGWEIMGDGDIHYYTSWVGDHSHNFTTNSSGSGNSQNMPPYRAVYQWYRSA